MAHGDALIFLTNIVWIFFLFIFIYLFFVVFFLPSFYKKFRIRVLVRGVIKTISVLSIRNILVSLTFFLEFFRGTYLQILGFLAGSLFYLNFRAFVTLSSLSAARVETVNTTPMNTLYVDASVTNRGGAGFIKFKN